ncbi:hypothetical protein [Shimia thalassica]|uniref:hypothetical protein n=1 Tax=Shimia thalassica TaxID=1715693 RepID=UPI0011A8EB1D|nr:hypothetical protein [Shimia thalassica]
MTCLRFAGVAIALISQTPLAVKIIHDADVLKAQRGVAMAEVLGRAGYSPPRNLDGSMSQ